MELFRVETGAIPGQSCSEETMPFLRRSSRKNEPPLPLNSRVFLVSDSLASVANMSLTLAKPSDSHKDSTPPSSLTTQKNSETNPAISHEYRQLSPKNLLPNKCSVSETERPISKIEFKESSTVIASQPDPPSTSSVNQSHNSQAPSGKKKTLGELAKEWNANQSPEQKKDKGTKVEQPIVSTTEDDLALVRHSAYYSTSSSIHGMSSHENRLRNKLKARQNQNRDEILYQEKKTTSVPLIKLHAVATE